MVYINSKNRLTVQLICVTSAAELQIKGKERGEKNKEL